jgi:hypothetical protein
MSSVILSLRQALINYYFGNKALTPPSNLYYGLFTTTPDGDGADGVEVTGTGYGRVEVVNNAANFPDASGAAVKSNGLTVSFPAAGGSWGTVTGVGIFSTSSGSTLLAWAAIAAPTVVTNDRTVYLNPEDFSITVT